MQLIYPPVDHKKVVDFLWDHLNTDINQLSVACGKSQDDCFFIMHMVLHNMISVQQSQQGKWNKVSNIFIQLFFSLSVTEVLFFSKSMSVGRYFKEEHKSIY